MVTVLTQPNCMPCLYTTKRLDKRGVAYQTRPVTELSSEELDTYRSQGHNQAPIVVLPNGDTWSGFRPDLIQAL